MKILIMTQKVDMNDDVLGFFHGWLKEFSKYFSKITVICLGKGEYDLPQNIKVFSLGKEEKVSRSRYVINFLKIIWKERSEYDVVFVHMNKEYVLLGFLLWKILRKKILFWYNHPLADIFALKASLFADVLLYTSPQSYFSKIKKAIQMPVGIDTTLFKNNNEQCDRNSILSLGRISPIKNTHLLVEAVNQLNRGGLKINTTFVGNVLEKDNDYYENLKNNSQDINFEKAIANKDSVVVYNHNAIFVNMTKSGSFDKTIFEAMACERIVVASNEGFKNIIKEEYRDILVFEEGNSDDLALKIKSAINLSPEKSLDIGRYLREIVVDNHSLSILAKKLFSIV
ncbi:MAG: glycosyltransferase family 4 protein [Patescibacteria group bacterium]|nr:glycosyltransferase family 4 protein [Patescibacteria group bacterium]